MNIKKNDIIRISIDAVTSEGSGVGRYEGFAVFVRLAVPGDIIDAHIIKVSKNYAVARIESIVTPSKSRIDDSCPVQSQCGGCSTRQMTYDEELKFKLSRVNDALKRIGHLDVVCNDILGAENTEHYRNKAQYPVMIKDGELEVGFYAYKSHRVVPCDDCLLQPIEFEKGIKAFKKYVKASAITSYDEKTGKGLLRHIYFRKAFGTNQLMACAVINGKKLVKEELLVKYLVEEIPDITSISVNINTKNTNVILGDVTKTIYGSETIEDKLLSKVFAISPNSFYQVNHCQCEHLYTIAKQFADLKGDETLLDLYCGAGTIGIIMADNVKSLIGVEIISDAIENAKQNAKINNIENARFICADAPNAADMLQKEGITPDVVVVDPPRKGCDTGVLDAINKMGTKRIVYVSCDPSTLARDLEILTSMGYSVEKIKAVDMFPRTPHVESVVLLTKE